MLSIARQARGPCRRQAAVAARSRHTAASVRRIPSVAALNLLRPLPGAVASLSSATSGTATGSTPSLSPLLLLLRRDCLSSSAAAGGRTTASSWRAVTSSATIRGADGAGEAGAARHSEDAGGGIFVGGASEGLGDGGAEEWDGAVLGVSDSSEVCFLEAEGEEESEREEEEEKEEVVVVESLSEEDEVLKAQIKDPSMMRLSRRIARSGVASRRQAERLVEEGVVTVNGKPVQTPALNVGPKDVVKINGKALERPEDHTPKLWLVHKTRNELVTRHDPEGRATVFDRLAKLKMPDTLMPVGRLDYNTEGLLLLTNDGNLARLMELPSSGIVRTYSVRVYGNITEEKLRAMRNGCTIDGVRYKGMFVRVEGGGGKGREGRNAWLTIECTEGKNRQIRKICKYLCLTVNRLARTRYGPFSLGKVRSGGVARVEIPKAFLRRLEEGTAAGSPGGGGDRRRVGPGPGKGGRREAEAAAGGASPPAYNQAAGGGGRARGGGEAYSGGEGSGSRGARGSWGGAKGRRGVRIRKGVGAPMSRGDSSARAREQQRAW